METKLSLIILLCCAWLCFSKPLTRPEHVRNELVIPAQDDHVDELVNGILDGEEDIEDLGTEDEVHVRKTRSAAGLSGDILFSARRLFRVFYGFDYSQLQNTSPYKASLRVYKKPLSAKAKARKQARKLKQRKGSKRNKMEDYARVSVYQVVNAINGQHSSIKLLQSRLISESSKGWFSFDISQAVNDWATHSQSNFGLEVWIESSLPGKRPAKVSKRMKFVKPRSKEENRRPELVITFAEEDKNKNQNDI